MPKIIGQAEQQAALREIKSALKEMVDTNLFLEAKNNICCITSCTSVFYVPLKGTSHLSKGEFKSRS